MHLCNEGLAGNVCCLEAMSMMRILFHHSRFILAQVMASFKKIQRGTD